MMPLHSYFLEIIVSSHSAFIPTSAPMALLLSRLLFGLLAFQVASLRRKTQEAQRSKTTQFLWDRYKARISKEYGSRSGVQPPCEPQYHKGSGSFAGTIMLFHGFTACPQQFDELLPLLTSKGFDVFMPLNPGHGYVATTDRSGNVTDYIAALPTAQNEYEAFAYEMHMIMQTTAQPRALMGMSLGGTLAAHVGQKGGYDRQLLAAPMIKVAGILDTIITAAGLSEQLQNQRHGWPGDACENERRQGRAGICQFTAKIGFTARNFGLYALSRARPVTYGTMEIIFVEDDGAVSVSAVQDLALKYGINSASRNICGFDKVVGHSFLSPYDNPDEDKFWLKEANQKVADYLTTGATLKQDGKIGGWPRCELRSR